MVKSVVLKVEKGISSKSGREYVRAYVDLGYRQAYISYDVGLIAEILGVSVAELYKILNEEEE